MEEPRDKPVVSIILLAYNNLDYTKACVESIYRNTTQVDFELITVNNGSTDKTGEFFNLLPNTKKVNILHNCSTAMAFNEGFKIADGEFTLLMSNDLILTPNCIDNLIKCAKSDSTIGMIAPVCGCTSSLQQVSLTYKNIDELYETAEKYNKSDSLKWEEKLRLVNYLSVFRTDLIRKLVGLEEIYNSEEFYDDDISFRIRRAGYKLILAKDTYVHRFRLLSKRQEYEKGYLNERNKKIFLSKFGVDAWEDTDVNMEILALVDYSKSESTKILGIGIQCGGTILEIKNRFIQNGVKNVKLWGLTKEERYLADLKTICVNAVCGDEENVSQIFMGEKFDYIVIDNTLLDFDHTEEFFKNLKTIIKEDGQLIFSVPNELYFPNLVNLINNNIDSDNDNILRRYPNLNRLSKLLQKNGFQKLRMIYSKVTPSAEDAISIEKLKQAFPLEKRDLFCTRRIIFTATDIKTFKSILFYSGYDFWQNGLIFENRDFVNSLGVDIGENSLCVLRDEFRKYGYEMTTLDNPQDIDDAEFVIFNDVPKNYSNHFFTYIYNHVYKGQIYLDEFVKKKLQGKTKAKLIARLDEPPFVMPENYDKKILDNFDMVFTYYDNLVDNEKYFKYYIPQPDRVENPYARGYYEKKLCTFVGSYKSSDVQDELYSERQKAISFFERYHIADFDFYGKGWNKKDHLSYKGAIKNKLEILSGYKFCICYENGIINDWISEKIFDCFFAGCVPIYLGAPNITDYIPDGTFIDKRKLDDYSKLFKFIRSIDEAKYNEYLSNIKLFLSSEDYKKFTRSSFAQNLVKVIISKWGSISNE